MLIGNKEINYFLNYIPGKRGSVDFIEREMRIIDGYINSEPERANNYNSNKKKEDAKEDKLEELENQNNNN